MPLRQRSVPLVSLRQIALVEWLHPVPFGDELAPFVAIQAGVVPSTSSFRRSNLQAV
jgi:hypothetical protein